MKKARGEEVVRFALGGPEDEEDSWRTVVPAIAIPSAALLALPMVPFWIRVAVVTAVIVAAAVGLARRPPRARKPKRWVIIDGTRITRTDENGVAVVATFSARFGVTVLSNHARSRALLAFTTPEQTRYVRLRIERPEDATRARELLARASTVPDADLLGAEDEDALSASSALRLLEIVEARSPGALDRMYLTDPRGAAIVLEGEELRLGERIVDLTAPLEWRGFMFHESLGHQTTIYQATWLRQSAIELVLVAAMPNEISPWMVGRTPRSVGSVTRDTLVQRALVRDLRLMQSLPDVPPPREQRMAVERLFMLPLRQALDRAPRVARTSVPPKHATW